MESCRDGAVAHLLKSIGNKYQYATRETVVSKDGPPLNISPGLYVARVRFARVSALLTQNVEENCLLIELNWKVGGNYLMYVRVVIGTRFGRGALTSNASVEPETGWHLDGRYSLREFDIAQPTLTVRHTSHISAREDNKQDREATNTT